MRREKKTNRAEGQSSNALPSVLLCVVVVVVCALFGADLPRLLRRITRRGSLREGLNGIDQECDLDSECDSRYCKMNDSDDPDKSTSSKNGTCQHKDLDGPLKMGYYFALGTATTRAKRT